MVISMVFVCECVFLVLFYFVLFVRGIFDGVAVLFLLFAAVFYLLLSSIR